MDLGVELHTILGVHVYSIRILYSKVGKVGKVGKVPTLLPVTYLEKGAARRIDLVALNLPK